MARLISLKKNPRYFQDPAGFPVVFSGVSATTELLRAELDDHALFRSLSRSGINLVHLNLDAEDRDPAQWISPYKRGKGSGRTIAGFRRFDLTQMNPAYWERIAALLRHAGQNGIYTILSLFHGPTFDPDSTGWASSAWNPANHVNADVFGADLPASDPDQIRRTLFSPAVGEPETLSETFTAERQQEFLDAALDACGEVPGVIVHLGGTGAPVEWMSHWAAHLDRESPAPFVLNAETADLDAQLPSQGHVTLTLPETGSPDPQGKALFYLGTGGKTNETSSPSDLRKTAWELFIQGAQWIYAPEAEPAEPELHAVTVTRRFIRERRVRYWQMRPVVSAAGHPLLVRLDDRYLAYLPAGGTIRLNLSNCTGTFTVTWWHAGEEYPMTSGSVMAGHEREFLAPDAGEWVLDLHKKIR